MGWDQINEWDEIKLMNESRESMNESTELTKERMSEWMNELIQNVEDVIINNK